MSAVVNGAIYRDLLPVPHVAEATEYISADALTIGVEYRTFDPAVAAANYTPEQIEEAGGLEALFSDKGVTLHVFATDGLVEYLRFDCFDDEPHYHYIVPEVGNTFVRFDPLSNGPMLEWAAEAVKTRTAQMLTALGAGNLAESIDQDALVRAVDQAVQVARSKVAGATSAP